MKTIVIKQEAFFPTCIGIVFVCIITLTLKDDLNLGVLDNLQFAKQILKLFAAIIYYFMKNQSLVFITMK